MKHLFYWLEMLGKTNKTLKNSLEEIKKSIWTYFPREKGHRCLQIFNKIYRHLFILLYALYIHIKIVVIIKIMQGLTKASFT